MALDDKTIQNKMMTGAPTQKEFHFAATAEHYAEVVYAETIEAAEEIYHKVKRPIDPAKSGSFAGYNVRQPGEQSTGPVEQEIKE
jgi:hypothetical protein